MSIDFTGMIAFAQSLAETVKQAQTATEQLADSRADYAALKHDYETVCADRNDWRADAQLNAEDIVRLKLVIENLRKQNAEVSEALAAAKAKLNSFRQLLGVDDGPSAPLPTPAMLSEQPTNAVAEPADKAQPVEPAVAPGTGGVEPRDPATLAETIERYPAPMSYRDADDPAGEPFKSEPQSPEVAEPRPTSPSAPDSASTSADDRFGQAQEAAREPDEVAREVHEPSWRDSASHVPYRAFNF